MDILRRMDQPRPATESDPAIAGEGAAMPVAHPGPRGPGVGIAVILPIAVTLLSFSGVVALLVSRPIALTDEARAEAIAAVAATRRPTAAPVRTAEPAAARRAVTASATVEPVGVGSTYRVTFNWTLEGAQDGDPVVIRFAVGNAPATQQRGTLAAPVFDSRTGVFRVATEQPCSADGWRAELVSLRGEPVTGEVVATAAGAACR